MSRGDVTSLMREDDNHVAGSAFKNSLIGLMPESPPIADDVMLAAAVQARNAILL